MTKLIAPEVPGCPDPIIEKAVLDNTRIFCFKSQLLRLEIEPIALINGQAEYSIVPPDGYETTGIARAWVNGRELGPMVRRPVKKPSGNSPTHWLYPSTNKISVHPIPNAKTEASSAEIEAEVFLRPTLTATGCEDEILDLYEPVIVSGAMGKLFSMSKKSWTDLQLSDFHMREFRRGLSEALVESLRGKTSYRHSAFPEIV